MTEKLGRVLWLLPPKTSDRTKYVVNKIYPKPSTIHFAELSSGALRRKPKTKAKLELNPLFIPKFHQALQQKIRLLNPKVIVINDRSSLELITGKYTSLSQTRGSVYLYQFNGKEYPCIVVNDLKATFKLKYNKWILKKDLGKIYRWASGSMRQMPKLRYRVTRTYEEFLEFIKVADEALVISADIETSGTTITCIGYACLMKSGKIQTYVVPFYCATGAFWRAENEQNSKQLEARIWQGIRHVHQNKNFKLFQNGSYDTSHLLAYRLPLRNYTFDCLHMWHSIWCELPKKIYFQASILLDFYRYWKDEGKEDLGEDDKNLKVPVSNEGFEDYWLYNAMDCHITLCCFQQLIRYANQFDWVTENYNREFSLQFGPLLFANMTHLKADENRIKEHELENSREAAKAKVDLLTMVNNANFNPKSASQVKILIYDVLQAKELPRKGRSTDEKILKEIRAQSLLLKIIIEQIWKVKKAENNISKYGTGSNNVKNGRFFYKLYAAGTPTERLASKQSDFWIGTNLQSIPKKMRDIIVADDGKLIGDADYSQSDAYFTAFTSEDENFIRTMRGENGNDTHCYHAAMFFKRTYEELHAAHEREEEWTDHPTRGIRNITKRIVYGSNYFMTGYTLLITMGREAAVATAKFLGYEDAAKWTIKKLSAFCETLLDAYYELYPNIKKTIEKKKFEAMRNGNLVTNCWGYSRIFFDDLEKNKAAVREFAAFFGQSGTAGNINKAMMRIHQAWREGLDVQLHGQVHDSLIFQFPEDKPEVAFQVIELMKNKCTIAGQTFIVPAEVKVGKNWKDLHALKQ